ncbi:MAG TPA: hypothetical protein VMU08_13840 [Rhizomicrobium sp.]|nr:hypothetical protein [Rhizomicrobium sp.]
MKILHRVAVVAVACLAGMSVASAQCEKPPKPVADYLKAHPGWRILTVGDLSKDQQMEWNESHKAFCPGLAEAVLDATGEKSYALALVDKPARQEEALILHGATPVMIYPASPSVGIVTYRMPPGQYDEGGRKIAIAHDSVMYEFFESAAQQFYFVNGKLRKLQAGD